MLTEDTAIDDLRRWYDTSSDRLVPLPPSAYCSDSLLEVEIDRILHQEWVCVGHVSELSEAGDFVTFDIVDRPVLVVRDESGDIRAYSNVCRHRGCLVAEGCGSRRRFVCPYHSWTYDLAGDLRGALHMEPEDVDGISLSEYLVEVWEGMVFVSVNPDVEPLARGLEKLTPRVAPYDLASYQVVHRASAEIACNWKVLVENFCESYHVFSVHKDTLEPGSPTRTTTVQEGGPGFNHHTMDVADPGYLELPVLDQLPPDRRQHGHLMCIYPCTAHSIDATSALWLSILPTGPQTLRYTVWLAIPTGNDDAMATATELGVSAAYEFMAEDKVTIELVQRGLASMTSLAGVMHRWERTNWEFGRYLADRLVAG